MFIINNKFSVEQNNKMKPLMPMEYDGWMPCQWTESHQVGLKINVCSTFLCIYMKSGTIDFIVPSEFYQLLFVFYSLRPSRLWTSEPQACQISGN